MTCRKRSSTSPERYPPEYSWRPGADVRSISEVYMHVAGGNYCLLATFLGMDPPKMNGGHRCSCRRRRRPTSSPTQTIRSINAQRRERVADLEKPCEVLGTQTTYHSMLVTILSHLRPGTVGGTRWSGVVALVAVARAGSRQCPWTWWTWWTEWTSRCPLRSTLVATVHEELRMSFTYSEAPSP